MIAFSHMFVLNNRLHLTRLNKQSIVVPAQRTLFHVSLVTLKCLVLSLSCQASKDSPCRFFPAVFINLQEEEDDMPKRDADDMELPPQPKKARKTKPTKSKTLNGHVDPYR